MNITRTHPYRPAALILAAALACGAAVAGAADKSSARAEGEKYRQACLAGKSHQDRATCLKEANNYLADLKKNPGQFESNLNANTEANARARCEPMTGSERTACLARAGGQGKTSGSVESGGVLKELVTVEKMEPIQGSTQTPPAAAADTPAKP